MIASRSLHNNTFFYLDDLCLSHEIEIVFFLICVFAYLDHISLCIPKLFRVLLALYREKSYNKEVVLQVQNLIPVKKIQEKIFPCCVASVQ